MKCSEVKDLLVLYDEKELDAEKQQQVAQHLNECKDCAALLAGMHNVTQLYNSMGKESLPPNFVRDVQNKIDVGVVVPNKPVSMIYRPQTYVYSALLLICLACLYFNVKPKTQMQAQVQQTITAVVINDSNPNKTNVTSPVIKDVAKKTETVVFHPTSTVTDDTQKMVINKTVTVFAKLPEERQSTLLRGKSQNVDVKHVVKQWQDVRSGIKEKKVLIIKTEQEWRALWQQHNGNNASTLPLPDIDFAKNIVFAAFMGEQPTAGFGIQIKNIEETNTKYYLDIEEATPGSAATQTGQKIQPYHIVVIDK